MEVVKLEVATEQQSDELKKFYESFSIKGPVEIQVRRSQSYFDQYRLQSDDFETYCLRDREGRLRGTATILFRQGLIGGESQTIGYATDLRIAPDRRAILKWTEFFLPMIREALNRRDAKALFSVLSGVDPTIQNTLVRPRAQRRQIPTYHMISRLDIVAILGHLPFLYDRLAGVAIARATPNDLDPLIDFLKRKSAKRNLAFNYSREMIEKRFNTWPGLRCDSFLVAKNKKGEIVGTCAPWNNKSVQQLVPLNYSGFVATAKPALRVGSWFNLTNTLPAAGKEFEFEYLTHFYSDNPDIMACLMQEAYKFKAPNAALVYAHYHKFPLTLPPRQFLHSRTPAALYVVRPDSDEFPPELAHNPVWNPPEIELCLL